MEDELCEKKREQETMKEEAEDGVHLTLYI